MTVRCVGFALAIVAAGAIAGNGLAADSPRVFLVRTNSSTASAKEAMNRMQGELTAEGFQVSIVDSPGGEGSSLPEGQDANSVSIELVVDADEQAAELRVIDHLTNKTVIRRTKIDAEEASQVAQVLSVRAVELLRASLMELLIRSRTRPAVESSPANQASTWAAGAIQLPRESTWGFDAGSAGLVGLGGIGPAVLGLIRARMLLGHAFQIRATVAGLGTTPTVHGPSVNGLSAGKATVGQNFGVVELVATPWSGAVVSPVISVGAGPFYVTVDGSAGQGFTNVPQTARWAVALDGGVGLNLRLTESFDVSLETHAFFTRPYLYTTFADFKAPGPEIAQPSMLGALTVVVWL